mmetsp:Transcript_50446/g.94454  ORF Transcript_50446/g.94454 Transcript_50446/m.94454 type:complete len:156 (-) Transcript_50446:172-639(-)
MYVPVKENRLHQNSFLLSGPAGAPPKPQLELPGPPAFVHQAGCSLQIRRGVGSDLPPPAEKHDHEPDVVMCCSKFECPSHRVPPSLVQPHDATPLPKRCAERQPVVLKAVGSVPQRPGEKSSSQAGRVAKRICSEPHDASFLVASSPSCPMVHCS